MSTIYTVKSAHLICEAEKIEQHATESLTAWILVGQTDNYSNAMKTARALRQAANERSVSVRREILRNVGFCVKAPRAIPCGMIYLSAK